MEPDLAIGALDKGDFDKPIPVEARPRGNLREGILVCQQRFGEAAHRVPVAEPLELVLEFGVRAHGVGEVDEVQKGGENRAHVGLSESGSVIAAPTATRPAAPC
jgi:hypothetical protein